MTGLQQAVDALKAERARIDNALRAIEGVAHMVGGARATGGGARRRGRPPGRPRKVGRPAGRAGATPRVGGASSKAPRGLLKSKVYQVLQAAGKPVPPTVLRDAVMKAGYPSKNPQNLYTQIYAMAKKDGKLKKTADGFTMAGRRGRPAKTKVVAAKQV